MITKNEVFDSKMKQYVQFYEKKFHFFPFIKMSNLRSGLTNILEVFKLQKNSSKSSSENYNFDNFNKIVNKFVLYTKKNNIELIFDYLHQYKKTKNEEKKFKNKILSIIDKKSIRIIDIDNEFSIKGYKKFYPFGMHGHYNHKGYDFVAKKIYDKIK